MSVNQIGIFGKLTQLDHVMRERDRIEIYRPLIADPKEIRRQRAAEGKVMKKVLFRLRNARFYALSPPFFMTLPSAARWRLISLGSAIRGR